METPEQHATRFAADWYARPDYARDEGTLAAMLTEAMSDVASTADGLARDQIARRLTDLTRRRHAPR